MLPTVFFVTVFRSISVPQSKATQSHSHIVTGIQKIRGCNVAHSVFRHSISEYFGPTVKSHTVTQSYSHRNSKNKGMQCCPQCFSSQYFGVFRSHSQKPHSHTVI